MQALVVGRLQKLLHELMAQIVRAGRLQLRVGQKGRPVEVGDGVLVQIQGLQSLAAAQQLLAAPQCPVVQVQGGWAGRLHGRNRLGRRDGQILGLGEGLLALQVQHLQQVVLVHDGFLHVRGRERATRASTASWASINLPKA